MGYYVDKKQTLNVNKSLNDLTEEELEKRMNDIHTQYSHFIDLEEPEKKIINAEIEGDRKAEKYKRGFELARKMLRANGLEIEDPTSESYERIQTLRKISDPEPATKKSKKAMKELEEYQEERRKIRDKSKTQPEKIKW